MSIKNIQLVHVGEDYTTYSFERDGEVEQVEIQGVAQDIINTLGKALYKTSFTKKD